MNQAAKQLTLGDLEAGDILMSRGEGPISDAIVAADGGKYSHAALWSGSGVIEAYLGGVKEIPWRPAIPCRDVYRYCAPERPPGLARDVAEAVVSNARAQVRNRYDTIELMLLARAFSRKKNPSKSLVTSVLEFMGGRTASKLDEWLQKVYERSAPRVCTELVALAYYQVKSPTLKPEYALLVRHLTQRPVTSHDSEVEPGDASALDFQKFVRDLLRAGKASRAVAAALNVSEAEATGMLYGHVALLVGSRTSIDVVTPADIQFSPSLAFVGTVCA